MAEVVGVVAAAAQLATVCLGLLDLSKKIKGGSQTIQRYEDHLQHLHRLSTAISQTPGLQTPEVLSQTQSLLSLVERNTLSSLLHKGRWSRSWGLILRDKELQEAFQSIESHKSSLLLVIEHIQSQTLTEIQTDIRIMSSKNTRDMHRATSEPKGNRHKKSKKDKKDSKNESKKDPKNTTNNPGPTRTSSTAAGKQPEPANDTGAEQYPEQDSNTHYYFGATAGPGSLQVNGPSLDYEGDGHMDDYAPNITGIAPAVHVRPKHCGGGEQVNGPFIDHDGSLNENITLPSSKISWDKPTTVQAKPKPDCPPAADQYNGMRIRIRKKKTQLEPETDLVAMTPNQFPLGYYCDARLPQYGYASTGGQPLNAWQLPLAGTSSFPRSLPSTVAQDAESDTETEWARQGY